MSSILPEYNQQSAESELDWRYRIIIGKAQKRINLTWQQICSLLGLPYSGEHLRKIAYGILEYKEHRDNNCLGSSGSDDKLNELELKHIQLQAEKIRIQDQKRELNKVLREYARAEHIKNEMKQAITELKKYRPLTFATKKKVLPGEKEAALLLSDWHKGQHSANHWNLYNDIEFMKRIEKLVSKTIQHCLLHEVKTLHVISLGDMINGLIHVTTRINNTENSIKQVMSVAEVISGVLLALSHEISTVKAYFCRGNHDRVMANHKEALAGESFFDLIPWFLAERLKGAPNIQLIDNDHDPELVIACICGKTCFGVHGNRDKVNNVVQNLTHMHRVFPDYIFLGHYHHHEENEYHGTEIIVNSSLCGVDDYAVETRRTSKAGQKLIIFEATDGRLCTYNIKVAL